jgi:hypothetical protein
VSAFARLNDTIERVEDVFARRFTSKASVPFGSGPARLAFGKDGGAWRLIVERNSAQSFTSQPLACESVGTRIQALHAIPELWAAALAETAAQANAINGACDLVDEFLVGRG